MKPLIQQYNLLIKLMNDKKKEVSEYYTGKRIRFTFNQYKNGQEIKVQQLLTIQYVEVPEDEDYEFSFHCVDSYGNRTVVYESENFEVIKDV